MENANNIHIHTRLRAGQKVTCPYCGKGTLQPYNAPADKAHAYICDACDKGIHIEENVIIE